MAEVVYRASQGFSYVRSGASYNPDNWGQAFANPNATTIGTYWDTGYSVHQACLAFDLTDPVSGDALTAGATITSVSLTWRTLGHGATAQNVESYVFEWAGPGVWGHDESGDWRTIAQLQSLYDSGDGVCFSCAMPSGWMGASGKTFTTGPAGVSAVEAAIGGTLKLLAVVANYRAGNTPSDRFYCEWSMPNDATAAYRPTLTIEYEEGGPTGPPIPVIIHHLREQGIS